MSDVVLPSLGGPLADGPGPFVNLLLGVLGTPIGKAAGLGIVILVIVNGWRWLDDMARTEMEEEAEFQAAYTKYRIDNDSTMTMDQYVDARRWGYIEGEGSTRDTRHEDRETSETYDEYYESYADRDAYYG